MQTSSHVRLFVKCARFTLSVACCLMIAGSARAGDAVLDSWRDTPAAGQAALALARQAIDAYVRQGEIIDPPVHPPEPLRHAAAVFVSAQIDGAPRCCMGGLYPLDENAAEEIVDRAIDAAGRDRRFKPIRPNELTKMRIIVSIIGSVRSITAAEAGALDPVRQGLAVQCGDRYGIVLSGETTQIDRMLRWGKIRAGASSGEPTQYYALEDERYIEPPTGLMAGAKSQ